MGKDGKVLDVVSAEKGEDQRRGQQDRRDHRQNLDDVIGVMGDVDRRRVIDAQG